MWTIIYIAPTMEIAHRLRARMAEEGYEIRLRALSVGKSQQFEVSVHNHEVHEAHELLMQIIRE